MGKIDEACPEPTLGDQAMDAEMMCPAQVESPSRLGQPRGPGPTTLRLDIDTMTQILEIYKNLE